MLLSSILCGLVAGCGSGVRAVVTPPVAVAPVSAPVTAPIEVHDAPATVTNFGDSITCGYYALPANGSGYVYSNSGYAGVLDAGIGAPSQNICRAGDQAADMAKLWVYPNAVPKLGATQLYTVLIGTNDVNVCGDSAACLANYGSALAASLAWLAIPAADKVSVIASSTQTGVWVPDNLFATGLVTSARGSTLTFPVTQAVSGRKLYVGYRVFDPAALPGATASLLVDGVQVATLSAAIATGHNVQTQNGTTDTIFVTAVPLGAAGAHSVTLQMTSADGTYFSLLWAGTPSGNYASKTGAPRVMIGTVPPTTDASVNLKVASYNNALVSLVNGMVADGMHIDIAPVNAALDPATDLTDLVHPNTAGHAKLAKAFLDAL